MINFILFSQPGLLLEQLQDLLITLISCATTRFSSMSKAMHLSAVETEKTILCDIVVFKIGNSYSAWEI